MFSIDLSLIISTLELNISDMALNDSFAIHVRFGSLFRYLEIKQIRAYTFSSLVGNIGGYMGLFLGYAILNFPQLLMNMFASIKDMVRTGNIGTNYEHKSGKV